MNPKLNETREHTLPVDIPDSYPTSPFPQLALVMVAVIPSHHSLQSLKEVTEEALGMDNHHPPSYHETHEHGGP
jgi:hypothetical protein